jgi:hypothetical protein
MTDQSPTIRIASPEDDGALRRLAELDSAAPLSGRVLLAERDGMAVAAIALESGTVIADPFEHTAAAVHHLMGRRYQVMRQGGDVGPVRSLLRRLVPKPAR